MGARTLHSYQGFYFRPAKGEQVRTTLHPATEVRGAVCARVVDGEGAPVQDALALLFRTDEAGEYRLLAATCTDSAGYFAFGPLEPDTLYYIKLGAGSLRIREIELEN